MKKIEDIIYSYDKPCEDMAIELNNLFQDKKELKKIYFSFSYDHLDELFSKAKIKKEQGDCSKCGADSIKTKYINKDYRFSQYDLPHFFDEFIINLYSTKELLIKKCCNCGYSWCTDIIKEKT